jgi:class 3 adenylate cyclase
VNEASVESAARDQADTLLAPYLPRLVRGWSTELDGGRARTVAGSLVSVDISGFTALAERLGVKGRAGAEELVQRISTCFGELIEVAERHGGDVLKFRGDALLLFFTGSSHEARAAGAASDMQWRVRRSASSCLPRFAPTSPSRAERPSTARSRWRS